MTLDPGQFRQRPFRRDHAEAPGHDQRLEWDDTAIDDVAVEGVE